MVGNDTLILMYEKMLEIRCFEERIAELYARGLVPGLPHLYVGEEAVATGVCANLRIDDYVVGTHRGHGHSIAKGMPLKKLAAEIYCKESGCCKGRGGSMRVADINISMMYCSPIVGGNLPIATGMGLSIKMRGTSQVAVSFFGDGASNIGAFHEALNLASIWKLPVVFVCENNQYGISVPVSKSTSVRNIADRATAYNMPGVVVDGNDVIAVYEAARKAVGQAREGKGPTLLECKTYRWLGHHAGDPGTAYRTRGEVEGWKEKCPINRLRVLLLDRGVSREEDLRRIEDDVKARVGEAIRFAEESPYPPPEDVGKYVYASLGGRGL